MTITAFAPDARSAALSPATPPEIFVGGVPLTSMAKWGDLVTSTRVVGDWGASWSLIRDPRGRLPKNPLFRRGARVQVKLGPRVVWSGSLVKPDWDSGELTAIGRPRQGEGAICLLNALGQTTSNPDSAVTQAIARGALDWGWAGSLHNGSVLGATGKAERFDSVARLLDAAGEQLGWRWYIDQQGFVRTGPYPIEADVRWFLDPGGVEMGTTDVEQVDRVFVRYLDSTASGALSTASYPAATPPGGFEQGVAVTHMGAISPSEAAQIAEGLWTRTQATGWTNGFTVTADRVTSLGGQRPHLSSVRGGHGARALGLPDVRGIGFHTDFAIGETELRWSDKTLQVNPEGLVSDTFEDAIESIAPGGVAL